MVKTQGERLTRLEAHVIGNGGKGLLEEFREHRVEMAKFHHELTDPEERRKNCFYLMAQATKSSRVVLQMQRWGVIVMVMALAVDIIMRLVGAV